MLAWVENGKIRDISADPATCFHPDVAVLYDTEVSDSVKPGAELVDGEWVNPVVPTPSGGEAKYPKLSPLQFKMCFTSAERIAISAIKESDPIIKDAYELLDDARLKYVDLNLASNQGLLDYLTSIGKLAEGRKAEIMKGTQQ